MEFRQLVSAYVDELETDSPAPSFSHHRLAALRDRFGQSETDSAIDAELTNRKKQRDDGRRCSIPETDKPSDECNRLGNMFAN
jgi:hypothetical protein